MDNDTGMAIREQLVRIAETLEQIAALWQVKPPEAAQQPEQPRQRTEIDWENDFCSHNMLRLRNRLQNVIAGQPLLAKELLNGCTWPLCVEDLQEITLDRLACLGGIGYSTLSDVSEYFAAKYGPQPWMQITRPW
jgi:hypothetical protein